LVPGFQHGGEQPVERISHVFDLSLNKSHNDEQAFPHYDKKPIKINFFSKAWGLMGTAAYFVLTGKI
jgi:hypothetical protein